MNRFPVVPARFSAVLHVNILSAQYDVDLPLEFSDCVGLRVRRSGMQLVTPLICDVDRGCVRGLSVSLPSSVRPFFDRVLLPGSDCWLLVRSVPVSSAGADEQKQSTQHETQKSLIGGDGAIECAG